MTTTYGSKRASRPANAVHSKDVETQASKQPSADARHTNRKRQAVANRSVALAQATGQIVWIALPDGEIVDASSWCAFTGQALEQVSGRGWLNAVHPDDRERIERRWEEAATSQMPFELEYRARRYDSVYRSLVVRTVPVRDGRRRLREWVNAATDITERLQLEEALGEGEREQVARAEAETVSHHLRQLQEVTDTALSHLALADLVPAVLDRICGVMDVDSAAILLLTDDGQALTVYAGCGALQDDHVRVPLGQGIAGRIAASHQPLIVDDLSTIEVVRPILHDQLRSVAGVPLQVESRRIGVLQIGSAMPRQFAEPDIRLLQLVGDRIALAIDHVQLYELAQAGYAEAEARASELAATFATMTDGIFVSDREGGRVRSNQAFRQLLGLDLRPDSEEIPLAERGALLDIRDAQGQLVPTERLPIVRILRGEVLHGPTAVDLTMRALDGRAVEVNVTGAPVRTTDGGIVGAVAVYRDVTERRKLERRTREALQSLLGMAEVLVEPEGAAGTSMTVDTTGVVIQRLAELAHSLLGCKRMSFMTLDPETEQLKLILRADWPEPVEPRKNALEGRFRLRNFIPDALIERLRAGEVVVYDTTNTAPRGWLAHGVSQALLAPLRIGSHLIGLLGVDYGEQPHQFTDDERVLAGAVAQLSAVVIERERLLHEREEARAAELASSEATRQMELFMAMASHEFRTPLTVIKGYLQLAEQNLGSRLPDVEIVEPLARALQSARGSLAQAHQAAVRMTALLDDLLQVARAQAGKLSMHPQSCDVIGIVRDVVDEQRQANPTRQVHLRVPARRSILVVADPERIGQVVTNYLTNACKYSPEDQPIDVRVHVWEGMARVSVRDRGSGLPAAEQERVWGRFYQAPGIQRRMGSDTGLGLGLYICRTIIEQHEGRVGVESSVGKGSTFWFTLPLTTRDV